MDIWQIIAADEMGLFLRSSLPIEKISLKGSILDQNSLDVFSDVDFEVYLQHGSGFDMNSVISILSKHFSIFGYETHNNADNDLLRICLENGWRFDISFFYTKNKGSLLEETSFIGKINKIINQFWFMSSMVLVKLGRGDYLISSHLALELCQLVIVVQMLIRDDNKKTTAHRFGDKEYIPIFTQLLNSDNNNDIPKGILNVLYLAAGHMDKVSVRLNLGYPSRSAVLHNIQNRLGVTG